MKQLLSLFLFLLPCFALAQYPSNGNQKITLGEQTTADGLIWRGIASDTTLTVKSDTAAYFVLDTANINLYTYKASATGRKWRQLGADTAAIAYVNTYNSQTVNGAKTFTSAVTATRFNPTANTATGTGMFAPTSTSLGFSTDGTNKMTLTSAGNVGIGIASPAATLDIAAAQATLKLQSTTGTNTVFARLENTAGTLYIGRDNSIGTAFGFANAVILYETGANPMVFAINFAERLRITSEGKVGIGAASPTQALHVVGNARITTMNGIGDIGADANGVLQAATSDINLKNTIENSPFGLNEILLLNPVTFLYNDTDRKIDSDVKEVGFIAQDVFDIIPNAVSSTGNGDLQLDYRAITATLVKAIQEQQALIKALEQRIINLQNK